MADDDYAIVVGVQIYPDLGDLDGPENDARAMHAWLVDPKGGGVPTSRAKLILSSQFGPPFGSPVDAKPTVDAVQREFQELHVLAQKADAAGKGLRVGRRLWLFLAGHGFSPRDDQTALLMANATRWTPGFHILGPYTANWFYKSGIFSEVLLFMDCCRNVGQAASPYQPFGDVIASNAVDTGRYFFGFATKWSRLSRERPMPDGQVHGVFTWTLLQGLKGAASDPRDAAGQITAASLEAYLNDFMQSFLTPAELQDPEIPRAPDIDFKPRDATPFVIAAPQGTPATVGDRIRALFGGAVPPRFPVAIDLDPGIAGRKLQILGDKFQVVAAQNAVPPQWQTTLQRGTYLVQVVDGSQQVLEVSGLERTDAPARIQLA